MRNFDTHASTASIGTAMNDASIPVTKDVISTEQEALKWKDFLRGEIRKKVVHKLDRRTWFHSPTADSCPRKIDSKRWESSCSMITTLWRDAAKEVSSANPSATISLELDVDMRDGVSYNLTVFSVQLSITANENSF